MKTMKTILTVSFLVVLLLACAKNEENNTNHAGLRDARAAMEASNALYFTSYEKNDSSIFIDRYAEDACILPPNSTALCGRAAHAKFFRDSYSDYGMRNGKFITTAIYGDGKEFVTEEGLWQSFDGDGKLFDDGKFLVLWKKTKDGWKMYRDAFSSNRQL